MTELERKLLESGDALADAAERLAKGDNLASWWRFWDAMADYRAIAREVNSTEPHSGKE